jgi:ABC-type uncharacterized transport system substrate-binding protein
VRGRQYDRMIARRVVVFGVGGAAILWPLAVHAQTAMPMIGYLSGAAPGPSSLAALRQGLGETGYVEGQNLAIEYRLAEGHYDRLPAMASDLVGRKVDLIVAAGGLAAVQAAKSATATIPIVFPALSDPVEAGLVASLARPGGNLTGFSPFQLELMPKRLELLAELVPQVRVIPLLVNPNDPRSEDYARDMREAARTKGVEVPILKAATEGEIEASFAALLQLHAGALLVSPDPVFYSRGEQLLALAASHAVPAVYAWRDFAVSGGLISYGASIPALFRRAGIYAGRILKGAKPADLPVERPTKFELVVNLKTAKALGLTVPQALLARADEVIE